MSRRRTGLLAAWAAALSLALPATGQASLLTLPVPPVPPAQDGPYLPTAIEPNFGQGFGAGRGHEGFDLFAPAGTPLIAVAPSVVIASGAGSGGEGNNVALYDRRADRTYNYFHLRDLPLVEAGQSVDAGQVIGYLGCTGSCYGDHLHFEVRSGRGKWSTAVDPEPFLRGLEIRPQPNVAAISRLG